MILFGQKLHPLNSEYASRLVVRKGALEVAGRTFSARITCAQITPHCTRLIFENSNHPDTRNYSDAVVEPLRKGRAIAPDKNARSFTTAGCVVEFAAASFQIRFADGLILATAPDGFGFNGERATLNFLTPDATGYYGFGERTRRFNKSGDSLDFCNVDVGAVFPHTFVRDDYDPAYVSIPLAIVRTGGKCVGLFIDNPERLIFDVGQIEPGRLLCQSLGGHNHLYILAGPTLRDVVRQFTELTGRAELPPLWSLGYHQCRWGYKTAAEFRALRDKFREHDIPVSALWYDIDYMDGYRVFTWDRVDVPQPAALNRELKRSGIRTVAIFDPGVKREPGNAIYESGRKARAYCRTHSGRDYVGRVWPGDTVFPDFSTRAGAAWWTRQLTRFLRDSALDGAWLDMNEPATGWSAPDDMLFGGGTVSHGKYHNQYGHLMARASRAAFDALDPDARPFLLTRSGCTGTQRYAAVWTGDNASNWEHLRMSIPCTINLGLSGVAFNGPDVGGFFGHTDEELITRWYQAGFLFPFLRNHSTNHTKEQEPWNFGPDCLRRIRATVQTRYRLLPHLYQCFFAHHLTGDPILRPMLYEFEERAFENTDDQFLVGDSLLVAPIVESAATARSVVERGVRRQERCVTLPEGWWFDLMAGAWVSGDRTIPVVACLDEVPIFIRDGGIIPYFHGRLTNGDMALRHIELHIFTKEKTAQLDYHLDDGKSRRYLRGEYNVAHVEARAHAGRAQVRIVETGPLPRGSVRFTPVFYGAALDRVIVERDSKRQQRALRLGTRDWVGRQVPVSA